MSSSTLIVLDNNEVSWWSKEALASFDYRGNTSDHFIVEFGGDLLKIRTI